MPAMTLRYACWLFVPSRYHESMMKSQDGSNPDFASHYGMIAVLGSCGCLYQTAR
jgi:hypothetical protein